MAKRLYTKRYSQAVFEIALGAGELDRWQSDLRRITSLGEDVALVTVLESPRFRFDDKTKLLTERLSDVNPLALNLACLLVAKGRLSMIGDITDEYQRLLDSYRGIEQAEITTAIPLDDEDRLRLEERLKTVTGKKVVLKSAVDPNLIGGITVRVGGKLLDGSTRSKLATLKKALASKG